MSGAELGLALSVFLACTVEAVEALTIVLAVGSTRSWSSALSGVGAAALALAVIVAALGPAHHLAADRCAACRRRRPAVDLRPAVAAQGDPARRRVEGQARREQILRRRGRRRARGRRRTTGFDGYAFTIAFKGVLLEGLEVAFIVLTFGANQHRVALAAAAAGLAVLLVIAAGVAAQGAAGEGAGEHDEVRGRGDAQLVRDVLGRRGRRRELARRRRRSAGDRPGVLIVAVAMSKTAARTPGSSSGTDRTRSPWLTTTDRATVSA